MCEGAAYYTELIAQGLAVAPILTKTGTTPVRIMNSEGGSKDPSEFAPFLLASRYAEPANRNQALALASVATSVESGSGNWAPIATS
jgi:hypothetical protein